MINLLWNAKIVIVLETIIEIKIWYMNNIKGNTTETPKEEQSHNSKHPIY